MNIMDKPTLQEVKEYFKNTKEVKGNIGVYNGNIESIDDKLIYYYSDSDSDANGYYIDCDKGDFMLYDEQTNTYAEIISYKETLYQLTAKEIRYGAENPQWLKDTFKECFETELEVRRWYKSNDYGLWFIEELIHEDKEKSYGINHKGNWVKSGIRFKSKDYQPETEKEVEESLKNYFEKTNGIKFKYYIFNSEYNRLLGWDGSVRHNLFDDGTWKKPPTYTIPEAEEKFNIKIVEKKCIE